MTLSNQAPHLLVVDRNRIDHDSDDDQPTWWSRFQRRWKLPNVYWTLFLLGFVCTPLCWLFGSVGLTSTESGEWIAGIVNLLSFVLSLFFVIAIVALTGAP